MTIRYAPLYVIALTILISAIALAGASAPTLLTSLVVMACPVMLLLMMRGDNDRSPRTEDDHPQN
ncbi:hypothetical protein [Nocardia nepalensis]|uniref:hypothetical protein n=1 Tax=Nocardia nepalensis TaxID=3375448 RepID=UPI003B683DB6